MVVCQPLHVEAECLRTDPDLRRSLPQGSDLEFPRWRALATDGRLRVSCGLAADWPGLQRPRSPWRTGRTCNETAQVSDRYPCPCCGHRVLDAMPGSFEICPVCF
ncbi:CPCC family cysteine-rich protein [Streptomyces sp. NPDC097107]|uniref:CPCC family cysteine-rich protein n=1 Tax=Streptomyces sp. NPDC097107 TaxID=3366089 RepID=UPI0037F84FBF